ncbi:response regulator [Kaustia mangrovi]|uniref:histidine kinase n=1 Tax=Kaustia mangrovi TaxID=2593653 RepID=A0A7S8C898_9HYPH|nr:response regulator [Kaustia mangrovi]QPC45094.1 response regulator [Kaustia mangrovi]
MTDTRVKQERGQTVPLNDRSHGRQWLAILLALLLAVASAGAAYRFHGAAPLWALIALGIVSFLGLMAIFGTMAGLVHFGRASRRQQFFEALFDAVPEACVVTDRRGRVLYCNRRYRALVERAGLARLVGVESLYAGYPEISDRIYRLAQAARDGEGASEEFRLSAGSAAAGAYPDKSAWVRISVDCAVRDGGGGPVTLWRVADATDERARQEEAFEHLQFIINYLDHAPAGFFSADADGNIEYINATLAEWLGVDLAETTGGALNLKDIVADTGEQILAGAVPGPGGIAIESFDLDLKTRDGRIVPARIVHRLDFDEEGRQKPSRSLVLDMRPEAEGGMASEPTEIRLSRLVNSAPIGIAEVDEDGCIANANAAFTKVMGKKAARGAGLADLVGEEERGAIAQAVDAARDGRVPAPVDANLAGEEGRTAQLFFSRAEDAAGGAARVVVYAVDTTAHRSLEMQFAQSQKMQAIGQLAGGIAHDFNNVLTAIIGFSDLLLAKHRPTDPSFKDMMNIKQNANRAANLVRQLLAFSRQQTLRPEVLSLTDVLSDLGNLLGRLLGEKIELQITHGRDLWPVKADVNQFEQVIINLAVNARDAMPEGGTLTVRTANASVDKTKTPKPDVMPPGDYVLCEVSDTGTGMPREVLEKIYEPFFSTKDIGKGTGLGLSTVYGIVKQTGGFIFCDSEVGRGTTFRIYLPRHIQSEEKAPEDRADKRDARRADLTGKGTVLLVEDEEAVRAFAVRALAQRGYTVLEAERGDAAIELAAEHEDAIDLLISDVSMPEMDGPTLLKELRKRGMTAKVIFISGYAEDSFRKNLEDTEDFAFLPKPFTLKQLAAAVKDAMEG